MTDHLTAFTDEEAVKGGYRSVITPHLTTVHHQPQRPSRERRWHCLQEQGRHC